MRNALLLIALGLWLGISGCASTGVFHPASEEQAFRERYMRQPWYTAITLRPYPHPEGYLIDLTGRMAHEQFGVYRAANAIPFGARIRLVDIAANAVLARIDGYDDVFRILVATQRGAADEVGKELSILLSSDPPLSAVRVAMREVVARYQIVRGMSWREVYMSWGRPDKAEVMPSSSSTLEEWVYFDKRMHLFLENGYVTNWQQM